MEFNQNTEPAAQVLTANDWNISLASRRLRNGELVVFPTETVYGLGGNALNETAIQKIFQAKGRPLINPLIVHVASIKMALTLLEINAPQQQIFNCLAAACWPGPLTIVARAASHLSKSLTAGGDYIGVRYPDHPVAIKLVAQADVPVAGPSANQSGHVSPTCVDHVLADLGRVNLTILDGGVCQVGIESTVLKMDDHGELFILRRGVVTVHLIEEILQRSGYSRTVKIVDSHTASITVAQQAPGQLLTHYAPRISAYILREKPHEYDAKRTSFNLDACIIIDFGGEKINLAPHALAYMDLSASGQSCEAAANLFKLLRLAEETPGVFAIMLPNLGDLNDEILRGLFDRLYRSASGNFAWIDENNSIFVCQ